MIVVTGGTGFLGAHVLFDLCQNNESVRAIKRPNSDLEQVRRTFSYYSNQSDKLFKKIEWVDAEILDYFSLEQAFEGADIVYHSAAIVSFSEKDRQKMMDVNIQGTANVVNAALHRKVKKLCYVSSIAALGRAEKNKSVTEDTPWKDSDKSSPYSISKYRAELEVWRGIEEGLPAVIVNPSVILGPAKWDSGSAALFSLVGKGLKFYTAGTTGFVYVRDVSKAMIELTESPIVSQRYILNAENISYQTLFSTIARHLGKSSPSIPVKPWMSELSWRIMKIYSLITGKDPKLTKNTARASMQTSRYDSKKIIEAISLKYTSLEEMIKNTCKIYLLENKNN